MENGMSAKYIISVLLYFVLTFVVLAEAAPAVGNCVLGDGLLNSLAGKGIRDTGDNAAEEDVQGWLGSPEAAAHLIPAGSNLTQQQLEDCLKEYEKTSANNTPKPLPPGVVQDPSQVQYLPFTSGKDVAVGATGEYYTTYDGSRYGFKEKGYVLEPPEEPSPQSSTRPPTTQRTTTRKPTSKPSRKTKDELKLWYNAFVSVVSEYV